ncbi:hypothetical protein J2T21_003002 [Paeniglutamicibacter psychrophenolicus]|nr:hypothetical protein [Paeniglutamicibacter psychrophenolicus]
MAGPAPALGNFTISRVRSTSDIPEHRAGANNDDIDASNTAIFPRSRASKGIWVFGARGTTHYSRWCHRLCRLVAGGSLNGGDWLPTRPAMLNGTDLLASFASSDADQDAVVHDPVDGHADVDAGAGGLSAGASPSSGTAGRAPSSSRRAPWALAALVDASRPCAPRAAHRSPAGWKPYVLPEIRSAHRSGPGNASVSRAGRLTASARTSTDDNVAPSKATGGVQGEYLCFRGGSPQTRSMAPTGANIHDI